MNQVSEASGWGRQDAIGACGVAIVLALAGLLGVGPPVVEAMGREELQHALDQCLSETRDLAVDTEKLRAVQSGLERRLADSKVTLLPVSGLNKRLMDIVELGGAAGLTVAQVTPGVPRTARQCQVVAMTMTGTGGYPQMSDFLARVHTQFPDIVVAGFSAEARRSADVAGGAFVFELEWYAANEGGGSK